MFRLKLHRHGAEIQELQLESGREYTFGRGSNCDVQLEEQPGISRTHFRLIEENGNWTAQVLSKFGQISHGGQPVQTLTLEPGSVFKLGDYDFHFLEQARQQEAISSGNLPATLEDHAPQEQAPVSNLPMAVGDGMSHPGRALVPAGPLTGGSPFEGNDEATRVASHEPEAPYIRIVNPDRSEETMKLEGRRWFAGREEGCDILLNDRKASRRQFELSASPQGYFVRDLGSSNGTLLNGIQLASDELKAIRSGDVIQVGRVVIHFEVRDPEFDKKLMVVPQQVRSDYPIVVDNPYEMINYPVPSGPGGAVRVDGQQGGNWLAKIDQLPFAQNMDAEKRKKMRFWMIVGAILLPIVLLLMFSGNPKPQKAQGKTNIAFDKLSPKQQQQVKELYVLALNLYMQNKFALTDDQLQKLHAIIPEGYENSLAMARECADQAEQIRRLHDLEEQAKLQEQNRRIVEKTIIDCDSLANTTYSIDDLNRCLQPGLDRDPENPKLRELISRVQARIEQKHMDDVRRKEYQSEVAKGKALYQRAQALEFQQEYLDAMDAYRKHAESRYPDPEGLKPLSQRQLLSIQKKMSSKVDDALRAAEAAYGANNYRDALDNITKALKLDPKNEHAHDLNAKYRHEINSKMREIYEEAVISEGLGNVDDARQKWKKIIDTDHPDGEYYKKSKNKMRAYGNF